MIDINSRKKSHSADPNLDLNYHIARLADRMPPIFVLLDGIYTNERGPSFDGWIRRSNILVASEDILSADMVGAKVLGHEPAEIPHLVHAARHRQRPMDFSDIEVVGKDMQTVSSYHEYDFPYNEKGTLPRIMEKMGIKGLSYPKYDLSMCTYCSALNWIILTAIAQAWKAEPWNDVEILTGKIRKPTTGMKKTILMGKCMYEANRNHPDIQDMIPVKGCPPSPKAVINALHQVGIGVNPYFLEHVDKTPAFFMRKFEGKPEFDESFFAVA
jgi:Ni,Fe-hydrogenase III small subunit